ncbi:MAG: virulence factor [Campylobacterales bacterium]|nr:virulence factor [Campylobacterales bacterium]
MYAVTFDLDTNCLNTACPASPTNAYDDIKKFMSVNGFSWQQGNVYFGDNSINAVTCVLVVQRLAKTHPWFSSCVKDIRMLKIEELSDLLPAIS